MTGSLSNMIRWLIVAALAVGLHSPVLQAKSSKGPGKTEWSEQYVRKVLRVFAYGGLATDAQIEAWGRMPARRAIQQMLSFDVINEKLSPPEDASADHCGSLATLQTFWSSDAPDNPMAVKNRRFFEELTGANKLSYTAVQRTWVHAVTTRGCNPFLHKMGLYLTNYHASISISNTKPALMRAYYDDYIASLAAGDNFVQVMTKGAQHAAVARAYRHQYNVYNADGSFEGNEDFAREYLQLFFGIEGTTEDPEYYESVAIKNNALVLTGMNLDRTPDAYGSERRADWWMAPIRFYNHEDESGRKVKNKALHYRSELEENSCIEVLHADICGKNARQKLNQLGPVAAAHPESMNNVPVQIVNFFADDALTPQKKQVIRRLWREAGYDLLEFIRSYAISKAFHNPTTVKYFTAFERNLIVHNLSTLSNEENFGKGLFYTPRNRMRDQGVEVFEPIRNVFGHQTGLDAVSDPFIFKNAFLQNTDNGSYHHVRRVTYKLEADGPDYVFEKDWGSVIPVNDDREHIVSEVAEYLWKRFIGDGLRNFDPIARSQVYALLATGQDFGYLVDPDNADPDIFYSSLDILGDHDRATAMYDELAGQRMSFTVLENNRRVGMAINFITMTPFAFAMEGP